MNNNFSDFLKLKLLKLLSNKRVYELPNFPSLNPFVLVKKDINQYIKYLNDFFILPQEFEIIETIGHENVIIVIGNYKENSTAVKNGFILLADENTNPIFLKYENVNGDIEKKILLTTYNKSGIETKFPEFKQASLDINNFIYGIFANVEDPLNKEFSLFKINNFINDYYLSFPIFVFQTFKLNDSFKFQEGEQPINYKNNVEKADFFKLEQSFGNDGIFDILFGYKTNKLPDPSTAYYVNIFYMCVDLNELIVKYISSPLGFQTIQNIYTNRLAIASQILDNNFKGIFITYSNSVEGEITYSDRPRCYKLTINENIPYIVLFSLMLFGYPFNDILFNSNLFWMSEIIFIDIDTFYCLCYDIQSFPLVGFAFVKTSLKREAFKQTDYLYNTTSYFTDNLENLNSWNKIFKKTYSKENRQYIICFKIILNARSGWFNTSGIVITPWIWNVGITSVKTKILFDYSDKLQIGDNPQKTDFVVALKQQNRINLLTINNSLPTIIEPHNLIKTQTTYNYGGTESLPWYAPPYDSDLGNFNIVHIQSAQVDAPTQYELIGDINLIDYTNTNNNLIYSFKLNQTTMNDLANNFWFLKAKTGQLIFKIPLSISKTIFEEKTLNFITNIILYLEDKNINNNEFSGELLKIFNNKNDELTLENLTIPYIKIFLENGNNDIVNIVDYWIINDSIFEMSLNVILFFKYKTNKPIKYQLLSANNIIVYEKEILNFDISKNLLEISHKFYYN